MVSRVWILGAGFSVPLGGPLLKDLMSMRSLHKLRDHYPMTFDNMSLETALVYAIYHYGRNLPEKYLFRRLTDVPLGEDLFSDAEQFLVDLPKLKPKQFEHLFDHAWSLLNVLNKLSPKTGIPVPQVSTRTQDRLTITQASLTTAAKRIMAAECEAFISTVKDNLEPCVPFKAWAEQLGEDDTIITFNYDRAAELLSDDKLSFEGIGINIPTSKGLGYPKLCKMHGSVDWKEEPKGKIKALANYRVDDSGYSPLIAIPGTDKQSMTQKGGLLERVWGVARAALRNADEVHIIGYGLPESDASAREMLMGSLLRNVRPNLEVNIVLGEPSFRSERLEATIRQTLAYRFHTAADQRAHKIRIEEIEYRLRTSKLGDNPSFTDPKPSPGEKTQALTAELDAAIRAFHGFSITVHPQYAQDYLSGYSNAASMKETLGW